MAADSLTDGTLVKSWQAGNENAYDQLFRRYFDRLYRYACQLVTDTCTSEEIVMDVMLSVWRKKGSLDSNLSVSAFMYKSVRNRVIDYARKRKIRTVAFDEINFPLWPSALSPDSIMCKKEMEHIYRQGLERLTPRKRDIFLMSREQGESYLSIANKLALSKNTVENHMVVALRQFKEHIARALSPSS